VTMQPGEATALWLPTGRFVTRWKDQRPTANNAVTAADPDDLRDTVANKFSPTALKNIGLFMFIGWADKDSGEEEAGMRQPPIVAFANVLSKDEVIARLGEVQDMIRNHPDPGPMWAEVFVRSGAPVADEEDARRRHRPRPRSSSRNGDWQG